MSGNFTITKWFISFWLGSRWRFSLGVLDGECYLGFETWAENCGPSKMYGFFSYLASNFAFGERYTR